MKNILKKLFELKKDSIVLHKDSQAYNYKYADLWQIQEKIAPSLEKLNLLVIHQTKNNLVTTTIFDVESGESISSEIDIGKITTTRESTDNKGIKTTEVTEQDPQAVWAIVTYYRRYNLLQLLDLKTEDNDWASASPRAKNNSNYWF